VVFDKVRENTAGLLGSGRSTYSQAANLALNQTLIRSINTSIIALLPVAAILFIGSAVLGPGELQDLALVLFVGMLSGTYSSLCIATPVLADLKEREPQYKALAKRVALREAGGRAARRKAEKALAGGAGGTAGRPAGGTAGRPAGPAGAAAGPAGAAAASAPAAADPPADEDSGRDIGDEGAGYTDEPEDTSQADEQEAAASTADKVPAGQGTSRTTPAPRSVRPGPRQQPRRTTAAGRRPGGKKKKR